MPISKTDRIARKLSHSKQERLQISNGVPSINELRAGVPVVRSTSEGVVEYTKYGNPKPKYYDMADSIVIAKAGFERCHGKRS